MRYIWERIEINTEFWSGNRNVRDHMEDPTIDGDAVQGVLKIRKRWRRLD
jgi:hypothetical protein